MEEKPKIQIPLKQDKSSFSEGDGDKPYSLWANAAILFSLIGTSIAVMLWIFLDAPIALAYLIWFIGFACALAVLTHFDEKVRRRGIGLAKAALVICILWIFVFLMLDSGYERANNYSASFSGHRSSLSYACNLYVGSYFQDDPDFISAANLPFRKDLLYMPIHNVDGYHRAIRIPYFKNEKMRKVLFNPWKLWKIKLLSDEEFWEALEIQEKKIKKLQEELQKKLESKEYANENEKSLLNEGLKDAIQEQLKIEVLKDELQQK